MPDTPVPPPFEACSGEAPFIFVSYSHKDAASVFPELVELHRRGYRVWYDEGIDPGNEWPEEIATALARSDMFLVFITNNAVNSKNVRNEINFALSDGDKKFVAVHLTETTLPLGMRLSMGSMQAILRYQMSEDGYRRKLEKALGPHLKSAAPDGDQSRTEPADKQNGEGEAVNRSDRDFFISFVEPQRRMLGLPTQPELPPTTLLDEAVASRPVNEEQLKENARALVEKCSEFDVRGEVVQINPGPVVTTYEFKPEAGLKYSRVRELADDLCPAMGADSILIERIPGKSTVGIQVPNHERETIHLRELIESETFAKAKPRLTLAMGKDINGRIVTADLSSMPHILVAGAQGSGKSTAIHGMILSLIYRSTPARLRLVLIDTKRAELKPYEALPHLLMPVVSEPASIVTVFGDAVREMERRFVLIANRNVRNIDQYNASWNKTSPPLAGDGASDGPLPYVVIVMDDLSGLFVPDYFALIEEPIVRLAQMARAVGIHMILGTQRPSVDVVTGLIKANIPARISFRLDSKVDSRTILDANGAEALLGKGDMLFLPPGTNRLTRLHAPLVSEKETAAVVEFFKAQCGAKSN
jgi:S-DNA-T family DNA segregation ATPase FtsK/SpoIIIE